MRLLNQQQQRAAVAGASVAAAAGAGSLGAAAAGAISAAAAAAEEQSYWIGAQWEVQEQQGREGWDRLRRQEEQRPAGVLLVAGR